MSAKTPKYQIEYALPSDKVADIAAISQRAATTIENLFAAQAARVQTGSLALNPLQPNEQTNTYSVTFAKPFTAPPVVFAQSGNQRHNVAIWNITATGFNWLVLNNTSGNAAAAEIMWLAVGA